MKKLISLFLVLTVCMTSGMSVSAVVTASEENVYLSEDFESETYNNFLPCNGADATAELVNENGNRYINVNAPDWTSMTMTHKTVTETEFKINFDFYFEGKMFGIFTGSRDSSDISKMMTLLWVKADGTAYCLNDGHVPYITENGSQSGTQTVLASGNWYSYSAVLNTVSRSITITIKNASGATVGRASLSNISRKTGTGDYYGWIAEGGAFSQLITMFSVKLDNISVISSSSTVSANGVNIYLGEDFDSNDCNSFFPCNGADASAEIVNENGNKYINVKAPDWTSMTMTHEAVKETEFKINFDFYFEGKMFGIFTGSRDSSDISKMMTLLWVKADGTAYCLNDGHAPYITETGEQGGTQTVLKSGNWYSCSAVLDTVSRSIAITIKNASGETVGSASLSNIARKTGTGDYYGWIAEGGEFCQLITMFSVKLDNIGVMSNADMIDVSASISNPMDGYRYNEDNLPSLCVRLKNSSNLDMKGCVTYEVVNANTNKKLLSKSISGYTIGKKKSVLEAFGEDISKIRGCVKFRVNVRCPLGNYSGEIPFSITESNYTDNDFLGYSTHHGLADEDVTTFLDITSDNGTGWVRDEILWSDVEKVKGQYSVPPEYENYIDELNKSGKKILLILGYGNDLYRGEGGRLAFKNYCVFMIEHFKDRVSAFEIWNEADSFVTGAHYALIMKAVYKAAKYDANNNIKPGMENVPILAGALCSMKKAEANKFLHEFIAQSNIGNYFDALSIHPYANNGCYSDEFDFDFYEHIDYVSTALSDAGLDKPIWVSEYGTSASAETGYNEYEQGVNLVRTALMAQTHPRMEKLILYTFLCGYGDGREENFGMIHLDHTAKSSFTALAFYNKLFAEADFVSKEAAGTYATREYTYYRFKNRHNQDDIFALWTSKINNSSKNIRLERDNANSGEAAITDEGNTLVMHVSQNENITMYDIDGNVINAFESGDVCALSEEPAYIVCSQAKDIEITSDNSIITVKGRNAKPGTFATVLVQNEVKPQKPIEYANQTKVDKYGEFEFSFKVDADEYYGIYVYNGKNKEGIYNAYAADEIKISYYVNDKPYSGQKLNPGDKIRGVIEVQGKASLNEELYFIGAVKGGGGKPVAVYQSGLQWDESGKITDTIELTVADPEDAEKIQLFLWNKNMTPLIEAVEIMPGK